MAGHFATFLGFGAVLAHFSLFGPVSCSGLFWTNLGCFVGVLECFAEVLCYCWLLWVILLCWLVFGHFSLFRTILGNFGPFGGREQQTDTQSGRQSENYKYTRMSGHYATFILGLGTQPFSPHTQVTGPFWPNKKQTKILVLRKIYKTKMLVKKIREKKLVNFLGVLLPSPLSIVRKGRLISLASFYDFLGKRKIWRSSSRKTLGFIMLDTHV